MAKAAGDDPIYEFGPFRLDSVERLLLRDGLVVPLTPKAFDLLVYLVQRHGRLAEKQALLSALWPDAIVEEGNLASNVAALRKVLDDGSSDSIIQTVPTKGYRFVGIVTAVGPIAPADSQPALRPGGARRGVGGMHGRLLARLRCRDRPRPEAGQPNRQRPSCSTRKTCTSAS